VALATLQGVAARRHALARQPRAWWGMVLAHLGMALCVTGMSVVRSLQTETELRMAPGDSVAVGAQVLRFEGVTATSGPNYEADRGGFVLLRDGVEVGRLHPEKRRYASLPSTPMTEAAIAGSWRGDVYVSLGEDLGGGAWSVRAQHKPLVTWIWAGAALMALGAALAAADRRRGAPATPTPAAAA
jgi:cytochrome c-type biogenesis protein CcmF